MKTFIVANITSYIGQCAEAVHYYCSIYRDVKINSDKTVKELHHCHTSFNKEELYKILNKEDAEILSAKDNGFKWREGTKVNRFNSLNEIKEELLKTFPDENIVTYENCRPYKEMLIKIDGKIKTIDYLGQVWSYLPRSVYTDLIPENFHVECECGKKYDTEYFKENIMVEQNYGDRPWTIFDIDMCDCCKRPYLMWDVIL